MVWLYGFKSGLLMCVCCKSDALTCLTVGQLDGSTAQTGYVLDSASNALTVPKALALQITDGLHYNSTQVKTG